MIKEKRSFILCNFSDFVEDIFVAPLEEVTLSAHRINAELLLTALDSDPAFTDANLSKNGFVLDPFHESFFLISFFHTRIYHRFLFNASLF